MKTLSFLSTLLICCAWLAGCNVSVNENNHDRINSDELCGDYCEQLLDCGAIRRSELGECRNECEEEAEDEPIETAATCSCVTHASCQEADDWSRDCGEDGHLPYLGVDFEFSLDISYDHDAADDDAADDDVLICERNHDCPLASDCVEGSCRQRCVASCQCPEGLSCDSDGYCARDMDPPQTCETDCDCPSGMACVDAECD